MNFTRRRFVQLSTALWSGMGLRPVQISAYPQRSTMASATWAGQGATINRKNFVGIQVKPFAWTDEGIDKVLDNLQEKGNVNTVFVYTYDTDPGRLKAGSKRELPGHGKYGNGTERLGGAYFDYDRKYFRNTRLKNFRVPSEGKFNVISDVAPKLKARGMDFFAWDYNNAFPAMMRYIPGFTEVSEIDIYGRRTSNLCFNHPDYRAFQIGKVESYLSGYASEVNGIMWGCESMGPLDNMIGGDFATRGITCFCEFCQAKGRERGISLERAKTGYLNLERLFNSGSNDQRPTDGYFITFWRTLLAYPEILSWQNLWMDSYREMRAELYGSAKAIAPEKPFGFHMMQNGTFSPFYSAAEDYSLTKHYADFVKVAVYNNAGGPRMARLVDRLAATVFRDGTPDDLFPMYQKMMNYDEKPLDQIITNGLSCEYVSRETKRILKDVDGAVQVYPGIDIDVPTSEGEKHTTPTDVEGAVKAALGAGANGVVLSRDYSEMWLTNLAAAGDASRSIFARA